jgi:hypothetical protein
MKAILEFSLPEEEDEHSLAVNARKYYTVLWDIDQQLRNKIKYSNASDDTIAAYEETRDLLWELLNDKGLDLDK